MKQLKTTLLAFFVIAVMGITATGSAMVSSQPAWTPNDGDTNFLSMSFYVEDAFKIDLQTEDITFFLSSSSNNGDKFNITLTSNQNWKSLYYDFTNNQFKDGDNAVLTLGSNNLFWFGYVDSKNNDIYTYTYTYTATIPNKQYLLDFDGHLVQVTDAQPVPLPGAALLLGAGLVGLVGVRRKYNIAG